jgi:serine/threonine protein kinase
MGQVWKARDSRLDRIVAIKVSNQQFSERSDREARAVAALNHPHVCQLYDVGPDYLVMEFVEGAPLKGPLPLEKAVEYARQILDALDAAHKKGITHRDLKPANILVTKAGIKVLDFGLAKFAQTKEALANNETATQTLTQAGAIVGTLRYMAPEQLQGKVVDTRADIFSFGCVLYEILTGKRTFGGTDASSVIAAILERPAPSVAEVATPVLDWALQRCLAKDPDERWQTARDLKAELVRIAAGGTEVPRQVAAGGASGRWMFVYGAASLLLATIAALAGGCSSRRPRRCGPSRA